MPHGVAVPMCRHIGEGMRLVIACFPFCVVRIDEQLTRSALLDMLSVRRVQDPPARGLIGTSKRDSRAGNATYWTFLIADLQKHMLPNFGMSRRTRRQHSLHVFVRPLNTFCRDALKEKRRFGCLCPLIRSTIMLKHSIDTLAFRAEVNYKHNGSRCGRMVN